MKTCNGILWNGGHCAYCGREINVKEMQIDHFNAKIQ
jgi:5-methylcytosine-specific restriction endonuclease McrA